MTDTPPDYTSPHSLIEGSRTTPLALLIAEKKAQLEVYAEGPLNVWVSGNLQVDSVSTGNLTSWAAQATLALNGGGPFNLPYWIMADNSYRTFSGPAEFLAFAQAALAYKTAAILQNRTLKTAIETAADASALAAIDVTAGWPS